MHCGLCLLILYVVTKTSLAALETLCLKDSGTVFSYLLNYDENDSAVELTVTSNYAGNFTFVKIQLSAIWESNIVNPLCHEDRLLLHTVEKVPATRNGFSVRLRHVYSGFYRLTVLPWMNSNSSLPSDSIHFLTHTSQQPVAVQNWTTQFTIHTIPRSDAIIVQFLPADDQYEFSQYEVILSPCQEEVSPPSFSDHALICYANQTKPECTFSKLKAGRYCAFVRPIDSRCNFGYVWQVKDYCIVHSDVIELQAIDGGIDWFHGDSVITGNSRWQSATIVATVLSSFLLIAILLGVVAHRFFGRKTKINLKEGQKFNTLDVDTTCDLMKSPLQKTVLLLWLQDECGLAIQVAQLKSLLSAHCSAKIIDIYDDELYDELSIDPMRWLNRTMSIEELRIVIVGSKNLELLYSEALDCPNNGTERPGSLESLVLYAIQLVWLRKTVSHSLHSSTFFVRFSDNWNEYHLGELTPFRCFLLPAHHSELLYYLNN